MHPEKSMHSHAKISTLVYNPLGVAIMTTSMWSQFPTFCRTPILPSVYKDYILFYEKKSWVK
jgi:hypothetical protein